MINKVEQPLGFAKLTFADAVIQLYGGHTDDISLCFRREMQRAKESTDEDWRLHAIESLEEAFQDLCDYKLTHG